MRLRPSWIGECTSSIQAAYFAQYGKKLVIRDSDLAKYLMDNEFDSCAAATAHFKRAISYYAEKYAILPKFAHLISDKIPALVNIEDWERALYATYPDFAPVLIVPNENKLDSATHGYSGLFPSDDIIATMIDFAKCVAGKTILDGYSDAALIVIERLIYSMAYRKCGTRSDYMVAIEAQKKLAVMRKKEVAKKKVRVNPHWSCVLVADQTLSLFGDSVSFWEIPKVVVNIDYGKRFFGIPKYNHTHSRAALEAMLEYAEGRRKYLKFLLTARPEFILDTHERELWREVAPTSLPVYPY